MVAKVPNWAPFLDLLVLGRNYAVQVILAVLNRSALALDSHLAYTEYCNHDFVSLGMENGIFPSLLLAIVLAVGDKGVT